jgi:putative transposase
VPHDTRDQLVDFVRDWSGKTDIPACRFLAWIGISASKFHDWKNRFGKVNEHNSHIPRDHWLTPDEKDRIHAFARANPLEGYRRLTFMMLDADVVACSPATVYRVLKDAGLLAGSSPKPSKKGTGFVQPLAAHDHWHVDVSYLNVAGTFYFLCSVRDVETIIQRAREAHPHARPRIITDNGPQFIAKDFKAFIRIAGMTHVATSPYYPQSNGKIERWHKTLKGDCIRVKVPLSLDEARTKVADYVIHYNTVRLHSAIGYVAPKDKLDGRDRDIFDARDRKLDEARERRRQRRQEQRRREQRRQPQCQRVVTRPAIDFTAVRAAATIADVLRLLGVPANTTRGGQRRGPCPLHGSTSGTSRCFSAHLDRNLFHCFKCNRSGNALDLWAAAKRLTPYDAAIDLCDRLSLPLPTLNRNREEEPVAPSSHPATMPMAPTEGPIQ